MAKYTGVTQTADGSWVYRIKIKLPDGKVVDTRIKKDEYGNPFLTARAAHEARKAHEASIRSNPDEYTPKKQEVTLADVYNNYMQTEAKSKAPATIRKQNSLWEVHINPLLGSRPINSITIIDLQSYLEELYRQQGYSYQYVQGFLRFFYLLFGHADRMEVIEPARYNKMFVSRGTRLTMPQMTQADHEDMEEGATVYTDNQLAWMERIFSSEGGNLLTAFYFGIHCGLRISETFALRWDSIDWKERTITVNRQMHYENNTLKLCAVKTLTSVRKVMLPSFMMDYLDDFYEQYRRNRGRYGQAYRNTERVYDEVKGEWITGGDFINRKVNGELLTVNSMKYWAKKIKEEMGIDFLYHNLRHTYATNCAINNVNLQLLMSMLGHKKIETTRRYYINTDNSELRKKTVKILDGMYEFHDIEEIDFYEGAKPTFYETRNSKGFKTPYMLQGEQPEDELMATRLAAIEKKRQKKKTQVVADVDRPIQEHKEPQDGNPPKKIPPLPEPGKPTKKAGRRK